jgi:hypothetical protein
MLRRVARGGRFARHHLGEAQSPFEIKAGARPLRVVLDMTTAPTSEALDVLRTFSYHADVEILEYRGRIPERGNRAAPEPRKGPGELLLDTEDDVGFLTVEALRDGKTTGTVAGERRPLRNIAEQYATSAEELEEAVVGLALCWATDALGFDALVTGNTSVFNRLHENFVSRGNPVSTVDGCWLLGLYLRSHDDYTLDIGESHSFTAGRSDFFAEVTRAVLPESWRWLSACGQGSTTTNLSSDMIGLGASGLERFDRALRARDRIMVMRQLGDDLDVIDEEILAFDVLLLMLSAVFDVLAVVATRAYPLSAHDRSVGWRRRGWRSELRKADRTLFDLTERGTTVRDAIDSVALPRNMVHGESLRTEFHWNRWPRRHRMRVPDGVASELTATATRQGGLEAFGLETGTLGLYIDPGIYAEKVFALATHAVNDLMAATPVERLVSDPSILLHGPPPDRREPFPSSWHRSRCRLLAGL